MSVNVKKKRQIDCLEKTMSKISENFIFLGDCWVWTKYKDKDGYGKIRLNGKKSGVHRAVYKLFIGEIPTGIFVCHTCDNPSCINPDHLWLGTLQDNVDDMIQKGREYKERYKYFCGTKNKNSKLNESDVLEMRRLNQEQGLGNRILAKKYNVHRVTIMKILRKETWKHI